MAQAGLSLATTAGTLTRPKGIDWADVLDTLEIAQTFADTGLSREDAAAINLIVQQATEHSDPATRADLNTAVTCLEARNAEFEVRLIRWMIGTVLGSGGGPSL